MSEKRLSVNFFKEMKESGTPITVLTAYDSILAGILDKAGIDLILVGDSLANVFQGKSTTVPVTLDEMIYHGEIVSRVVKHSFVTVDLPFLSYQVTPADAVRNAGRVMKETGCQAVKLEGGKRVQSASKRIVESGIPLLGHVGMTPQSVNAFGGFHVQGRGNEQAIFDDALAVEDAGAFAIVLEKIPADLAARITEKLTIPTIGIGAGLRCDGQVIVTPDLLGLLPDFNPKFVRKYTDLYTPAYESVKQYIEDVRGKTFPSENESYD